MATTCIWPVGNIQNPINYITQDAKVRLQEHPDATSEIADTFSLAEQQALLHIMNFQGQDADRKKLENVLGYAVQEKKTVWKNGNQFVTGINCSTQSALDEMILVKRQFNKTEGVACYHGYQSFVPGEVTPELAHTIGVELANRLWGDRYQIVVATHLDRDHLHNHFVLNSVSFVDGKKFRGQFLDYDKMRVMSDKLCQEYILSIIDRPQTGRLPSPKVYAEFGMERPTPIYEKIKVDVDTAIGCSSNLTEFYRYLQNMGYSFRSGNLKYFTIQAPGASRSTRLEKKLGADYSLEGIKRRIEKHEAAPLSQCDLQKMTNEKVQATTTRIHYCGTFHKHSQGKQRKTHFQRLYLYYCYRFGIFKKKQYGRMRYPTTEVRKMRSLSAETRLLITNHIDTSDDLQRYQQQLIQKMDSVVKDRKQYYNRLRSCSTEETPLIQQQINLKSEEIKNLRNKIKLCNSIQKRIERENLYAENTNDQKVKDENQENQKGGKNDGRTGRSKPDYQQDFGIGN